jgi:mono/diheme cytochrome c family protein
MKWSPSLRAMAFCLLVSLTACSDTGFEHGMEKQPKLKPLQPSEFFSDGRGSRPGVEGTVARGDLQEDTLFYTGKENGRDALRFPEPVSAKLLTRGRERYDIFCAVCHDRTGSGNGMIVQRGFPRPPSFHQARMVAAPVGHYFDVITHGFGRMYSYGDRVPPQDRWAIVAYIRALQRSQNAGLADVPAVDREKLGD